jgi:hypothetical protein
MSSGGWIPADSSSHDRASGSRSGGAAASADAFGEEEAEQSGFGGGYEDADFQFLRDEEALPVTLRNKQK